MSVFYITIEFDVKLYSIVLVITNSVLRIFVDQTCIHLHHLVAIDCSVDNSAYEAISIMDGITLHFLLQCKFYDE